MLFHRPTPLVPLRVVHLDLKGLPPTPRRLLDLLGLFAAMRYNAVLVEWEDAFPWTVDQRFRSETAYTARDVDAFHRIARELKLQVIPLVQSLGHMETPLHLPEYAHLREVSDECEGLNPLADGARQLVERMIDDVLAASGSITHFHLGGDEHFTFGRHPETRRRIEHQGKGAVYLHHVEPLLDRLLARGIRPILWHDMMSEWDDESLARLANKADLMFWAYQGHPDQAKSDKFHTKLIERFSRAGIKLWGAGAFKGADSRGDGELPDLARRTANALAWSDLSQRFALKGVAATGWSRYQTHRVQCEPIDGALDALLQFAAVLHDGKVAEAAGVEQWLRTHGEWDRFDACRSSLQHLAEAKSNAWQYVTLARGQRACESLDARRRGSGALRELHRLATEQLTAAEAAANDVRHALMSRIDQVWIDRFLAERLITLREALSIPH